MTPGESIAERIAASGLSIYDSIDLHPDLFYPTDILEARLDAKLVGTELHFPIRTRSAVAKAAVAKVLGYDAPKSFRRLRPRFPGQNLDVYVQKADNLQVWNEEISPTRRYALVRLDEFDRVTAVRVLSGEAIALLDRTGTLTSKFQATRRPGRTGTALVAAVDTANFIARLRPTDAISASDLSAQAVSDVPRPGRVLSIGAIFRRLAPLPGTILEDPGLDQERLRGIALQRRVSELLELGRYGDKGQFPDVLAQALEVKLQLSPTIDLGLVSPDDESDAVEIGQGIRHRDVRYAITYGQRTGLGSIHIDEYVLVTGEDFFNEFRRFEGMISNRKLQIPLPRGLFAR